MEYLSKSKRMKKVIEEILKDGEVHTVEEFVDMAMQQNIIEDKTDAVIRNSLFQMKGANPNLENIGKGQYRIRKREEIENEKSSETFGQALDYILEEVNKLRRFDWMHCSDREWMQAREKIAKLKKTFAEVQKLIG